MRQQILNLFTTPRDMSWEDILLNIVLAAVLGFFIFLSYAISHRGTIYSRKFNASLVILAVLTGTVMTVIGNNIALSLGMVGALSIVRFRTAIKDSRDTVYIFWSIIVGICCGVGDYAVACIGSAVTFAVILLLGCIKSDNRGCCSSSAPTAASRSRSRRRSTSSFAPRRRCVWKTRRRIRSS